MCPTTTDRETEREGWERCKYNRPLGERVRGGTTCMEKSLLRTLKTNLPLFSLIFFFPYFLNTTCAGNDCYYPKDLSCWLTASLFMKCHNKSELTLVCFQCMMFLCARWALSWLYERGLFHFLHLGLQMAAQNATGERHSSSTRGNLPSQGIQLDQRGWSRAAPSDIWKFT